MAYIVFGLFFLFVGLTLLWSEGHPQGMKMSVDFGEHQKSAGVVFVFVSFMLFYSGYRKLKE